MTKISWCRGDDGKVPMTLNAMVGCEILSPGCSNCYAMRQAADLVRRFGASKYRGLTEQSRGGPVWNGEVRFDEKTLLKALKWRKPRRCFVDSMGDLFYGRVPDFLIARHFAVFSAVPKSDFIILTKRSERQRALLNSSDFWDLVRGQLEVMRAAFEGALLDDEIDLSEGRLRNVLLGTSIEGHRYRHRWIDLVQTVAYRRVISIEPMLRRVDLREFGRFDEIDWILIGGESGHGARPVELNWIREVVAFAELQRIPVFVKQLGANAWDNGVRVVLSDPKGENLAEWPADLRVRQFPLAA